MDEVAETVLDEFGNLRQANALGIEHLTVQVDHIVKGRPLPRIIQHHVFSKFRFNGVEQIYVIKTMGQIDNMNLMAGAD